ncbi:MAG: hypothetical protein NZL87_08335 [Thermomicrobium sp.]|nr:hypothetical protein [Thermomicrobium sp.]MCS7246432.1 hypothetical protein [Thermomicrobium sp.]MDW7982974.1 hypothetical protein [Thermomicrobium sp.]
MSFDLRLWLLVVVSALLLVTIELTEDYLERGWPRVRRPVDGWASSEGVRLSWTAVGILVFPGIVLLLLNLAVLLWRDLGWSPVFVLGLLLTGLGWAGYLLLVSQIGGVDEYFEGIGATLPLALVAVLLVGDLLLLVAFLSVLPDVALRGLLP